MGYPITTQFSWDDDDDFHRYFGAQVVYDTFSDELRAGYAARIQARQAWLLAVDHGPDMSWSWQSASWNVKTAEVISETKKKQSLYGWI